MRKPRGVLSKRGDQAVTHERWPAPPDLAPYIEHFWSVTWKLPGGETFEAATLPHPSVHLVLENGRGEVAGVATGKFTRRLKGEGRVFSVKFRPAMFSAWLRGPMSSLTNRVVPIASVFGKEGAALARDADQARAEAFFRERLPARDVRRESLRDLVERMARDRAMIRLQDVVAASGLSLRPLQRHFLRYVGVNPKWVIQRYRLHEAAERLKLGPVDLTALALELGYFDQAHFTRDFRALVGKSPGAWSRQFRAT